MKINELVGYRNKPEYKAVKDSDYIGTLRSKLNSIGYKKYYVNNGVYGVVYANPEDNYVVKIFEPDQGYEKYLKYMIKNQENPYVPKLRGKPIRLPSGFTLVRIERLYPIDDDVFDEIKLAAFTKSDNESVKYLQKKIESRYPGLMKFMQKIKGMAKGNFRMDLHSGNMMIRKNNMPVITDPFVG